MNNKILQLRDIDIEKYINKEDIIEHDYLYSVKKDMIITRRTSSLTDKEFNKKKWFYRLQKLKNKIKRLFRCY